MKKVNQRNTVIFVAGLLVSLVLLNLLSLRGFVRFDLTRDKKFTLAKASIDTVRNLKDMMTVSAYFTEGLPPPYAQHARYVHDLLEEYVAKSNGKFAFEFIDPTKEETEEDREKKKQAVRDIFGRLVREPTSIEKELSELGLEPVEIRVIEDDQQQTKRAYMGVAIRYQEKHEVIPVVQNLGDLEKDMTSLMRKLTRTKEPVLGLVHDDSQSRISKVRNVLSQNVSIKELNLQSPEGIGSDVDALLVVGSSDLFGTDGAQKINTFLQNGKAGAFLMDRVVVDPRSFQGQPIGPRSSAHEIFELLSGYGVDIGHSLVADVSCASLNVQEQRGPFSFAMPLRYPFVPELMNLSFESSITKGLSGVILPFTADIKVKESPGEKVQILARSSKTSWLEKEPFNLNPRRNWGEENIEPNGPFDLLVEVRGTLPNPFNKEEKANPPKEETPKDTRLLVAGTSAFVWDEFMNQPNQVLALNIVDWMLADSAILEMRARDFIDAPLNSELSDTTKQMVKFGNILGVPILLVLYGFIRWRLRENSRKSKMFV